MFQYRITVDGTQSAILSTYPGAQWARIAEASEYHGLTATFERRLVTDADILELIPDPTGYIRLGARVACPWEVMATV